MHAAVGLSFLKGIEKMETVIHTDGSDERFAALCRQLDEFLDEKIGKEKQQTQYNAYNTLQAIHHAVLILVDGCAAACGAMKQYAPGAAEIKRVFVCPQYRRRGLAHKVLCELEQTAAEIGCSTLLLETGKPLTAAQKLYESCGWHQIPNYGQYAGVNTSVCMQKEL